MHLALDSKWILGPYQLCRITSRLLVLDLHSTWDGTYKDAVSGVINTEPRSGVKVELSGRPGFPVSNSPYGLWT